MLRILISLSILLIYTTVHTQVGINTTTPSQASVLDISSTSDAINFGGMLLPRATLTQRNSIPVTMADDGMLVYLIEGTTRCLQLYDGVAGTWRDVYCMPIGNLPPVASNVLISGILNVGELLTGSFTYTDNEGDLEGTHIYQWYRADDASGTNATAITGANSTTYTLVAADDGKYIAFEVTPEAQTGTSPRLAVRSLYNGAIGTPFTTISFVPQNQSLAEDATPNDIALSFSFPTISPSIVNVTVEADDYGRLTQSGPVIIQIPANEPSPYTTSVFNIANNGVDDVSKTLAYNPFSFAQ